MFIWDLIIRCPKRAYLVSEIWVRQDYLRPAISMSQYKTCFQSVKNSGGRKRTTDYLGSLKKLVCLFGV